MKIEDGKIKPCSKCLKARQAAKDLAAKVMTGRVAKKLLVETINGDVSVEDNIVVAVTNEDHGGMVGRRVYVGGRKLYDVDTSRPAPGIGQIIKVSAVD